MSYLPTHLVDLDLDAETWDALKAIAAEKECSVEQVIWTALDRWILREKGSNN
jgi:predicted DNA-binding ribbon-helix-helix protein